MSEGSPKKIRTVVGCFPGPGRRRAPLWLRALGKTLLILGAAATATLAASLLLRYAPAGVLALLALGCIVYSVTYQDLKRRER